MCNNLSQTLLFSDQQHLVLTPISSIFSGTMQANYREINRYIFYLVMRHFLENAMSLNVKEFEVI